MCHLFHLEKRENEYFIRGFATHEIYIFRFTRWNKWHIEYPLYNTSYKISQCMRFPTMWYVRPANAQTSLRIRAVWSEPLLVAWLFYDCKATDWTPFGVSKLKRKLQKLVRVYTCQNVTLLELINYICTYDVDRLRSHLVEDVVDVIRNC